MCENNRKTIRAKFSNAFLAIINAVWDFLIIFPTTGLMRSLQIRDILFIKPKLDFIWFFEIFAVLKVCLPVPVPKYFRSQFFSPPSGAIFCPKIQFYMGIVAIFLLFCAPQAKNLHFFRFTIQFPFYFPPISKSENFLIIFPNLKFLGSNLTFFSSDFRT